MKIMMDGNLKEDVMREGVSLSLKSPKNKMISSSFAKDYKKSLIKPSIAIFIISFSITIALISAYIAGEKFSFITVLLSVFYAFVISSPFIINICSNRRWYKTTKVLYELLQNKSSLVLELEEFSMKLSSGSEVIRSIYYSDLDCIDCYKHIIVFRSKDDKKTFFISSEYKEHLLIALKEFDLLYLIKDNEELERKK